MRVLAAILIMVSSAWAQNGATVEVRVSSPSKTAVFSVWLWPGGEQAASDEQGGARFVELPAGDYRAEITANGYAPADTSFTLRPGETRTLHLELFPLATLAEVVVQAESYSPAVQTFSRKDLEASSARDLGEFLAQQPGLDVRSEGASGSHTSLRIGGSNANQVTVLVDGARWQSDGSGEVDLSSIPVNWIERVALYRGSRPDAGGEGIGGIVEVVTRRPTGRSDLEAQVNLKETSQHYSLSREQRIGSFGGLIAYSRLQGPNDFRYRISTDDGDGSFTPDLGKTFRRINARIGRDQLLLKLGGELSEHWSGWISGAMDRARRGMPGYLAPMLTPDAQQETAQNALNAQAARTGRVFEARFRVSHQEAWQSYANPAPFAIVHHSQQVSRTIDAEASGKARVRRSVAGYGVSVARETISGCNLSGGSATRDRWATWGSLREILATSHLLSVIGEAGLRAEGFSDNRAILPRIALEAEATKAWPAGVGIAWGRSYRAPDFFALFWQDDQLTEGNPSLHPERSSEWTANAHLQSPWSNSTRIDVAGSWQRVEDLIYWHRSFDNRWKPLNLKSATIRTVGVSVTQDLLYDVWKLEMGGDWTDARDASDDRNTGGKYLTFRPLNSQRAALDYRDDHISGQIQWRRVSERPILETNSKWLAPYQMVDAEVGYSFRVRLTAIEPRVGVNNLLNEDYRIVRFAPMPLREWYITLRMRTP